MEVQSNENAALLKLLKSKSRTKTELLKVSRARRRVRQGAIGSSPEPQVSFNLVDFYHNESRLLGGWIR